MLKTARSIPGQPAERRLAPSVRVAADPPPAWPGRRSGPSRAGPPGLGILDIQSRAVRQYRGIFRVLSQLGGVALMETTVTPGTSGRVLLNSDMGEGLGLHEFGNDEELMRIIDVANVGCGYHAGDPDVMDR